MRGHLRRGWGGLMIAANNTCKSYREGVRILYVAFHWFVHLKVIIFLLALRAVQMSFENNYCVLHFEASSRNVLIYSICFISTRRTSARCLLASWCRKCLFSCWNLRYIYQLIDNFVINLVLHEKVGVPWAFQSLSPGNRCWYIWTQFWWEQKEWKKWV